MRHRFVKERSMPSHSQHDFCSYAMIKVVLSGMLGLEE